jgi:hypothetical protein
MPKGDLPLNGEENARFLRVNSQHKTSPEQAHSDAKKKL